LNTILKRDFEHPENKTGKNGINLFGNESQKIYPDFVSRAKDPKLVADAKYIPLDSHESYSESDERLISIYYKTIAYMYRLNSKRGFLFFPHEGAPFKKTYKIMATEGILTKIGFNIPKNPKDWNEFQRAMKESENVFRDMIK
jgi:5-methylcytosine-specific restriction endonuclease McrBC regulatory subunit McrC